MTMGFRVGSGDVERFPTDIPAGDDMGGREGMMEKVRERSKGSTFL